MAGSQNEVAGADAQAELPAVVVERVNFPLSARVSLVGIFLIMLIASLYLARSIVLPMVLATLLALSTAPLVRWFARRGISPVFSAVILVAGLAIVLLGGASLLRAPIADMVANAPHTAQVLRDRFETIRRPFVLLGEASRAVSASPPADGTTPSEVTVVGSQPSMLDALLGTLADVGSIVVATLLLAPFLLASMETLKLKLIRASPLLSDKKRSLRVLHEVEKRVARYLGTVTVINVGLGISIGVGMWAIGMPNPVLWGVGATLLNYVPYIGPLTGIGLAAAVSLTIHDDFIAALGAPAVYGALNSIEGTLVTPLTVGRRLSLSIVAILITLGLTTWMWGIIGTLIGVPILVVVKAFCDEFPSLAGIGMFISAESEPAEEAEAATTPAVAAVVAPAASASTTLAPTEALAAPRADRTL